MCDKMHELYRGSHNFHGVRFGVEDKIVHAIVVDLPYIVRRVDQVTIQKPSANL